MLAKNVEEKTNATIFHQQEMHLPSAKISIWMVKYRLFSKEWNHVSTDEKERLSMGFWPFSTHETCPLDEDDAILLVDV